MRIPIQTIGADRALNKAIAVSDGSVVASDIFRALKCGVCCAKRTGFGACMARCLATGQCCDSGLRNCFPV